MMRICHCSAAIFVSMLVFTSCGKAFSLSSHPPVIPDTASKELNTVESLQDTAVSLKTSLILLQKKSDTGANNSLTLSASKAQQMEPNREAITEQMDDFSDKPSLEPPDMLAEPVGLGAEIPGAEIPVEETASETVTGRNRKEKLLNIDVFRLG